PDNLRGGRGHFVCSIDGLLGEPHVAMMHDEFGKLFVAEACDFTETQTELDARDGVFKGRKRRCFTEVLVADGIEISSADQGKPHMAVGTSGIVCAKEIALEDVVAFAVSIPIADLSREDGFLFVQRFWEVYQIMLFKQNRGRGGEEDLPSPI